MSGSLPTCRSCRKLLDALAMASPHIGIGKIKMLRLGAFWLAVSCSRAHHWLTLQHLTLVFLKSGKLEAPGDTGEVWGWTVRSWLKFLLQAFSDLFPQVRGWCGTRVTCQSRSLYVDLARVTRVGGLFHGVFYHIKNRFHCFTSIRCPLPRTVHPFRNFFCKISCHRSCLWESGCIAELDLQFFRNCKITKHCWFLGWWVSFWMRDFVDMCLHVHVYVRMQISKCRGLRVHDSQETRPIWAILGYIACKLGCWTCACQGQNLFVGQATSKATQILARNRWKQKLSPAVVIAQAFVPPCAMCALDSR